MTKKCAWLLGVGLLALVSQHNPVGATDFEKRLIDASSREDLNPIQGEYTASTKAGQKHEMKLELIRYSEAADNHTTYRNMINNELRSRSELWPWENHPDMWLIFASENGTDSPLFDKTFVGIFTGGQVDHQKERTDYEIGYYLLSRARGYGIATKGLEFLLDLLAREDRYPYVREFFLRIRINGPETAASEKIARTNHFQKDLRSQVWVTSSALGYTWTLDGSKYRIDKKQTQKDQEWANKNK